MKIGFLGALKLVRDAQKLSASDIQALQTERFNRLVAHARQHSPLFQDLYQNLGDNPAITSLPATSKAQLMERFSDWLAEPALNKDMIERYLANEDNVGRYLAGKWFVYYTSGSTGNRCNIVHDKTTNNVLEAVSYFRSFPNHGSFIKSVLKGGRISAIAGPGFYLEYCTIRRQLLASPLNKLRAQLINVVTPTPEIVRQLNKFQPSMLNAFPTAIELLLPEVKAGRLKIKPDFVILGGENTTEYLKQRIQHAFNCEVLDMYGATECGNLASPCKAGHMHINADWAIIEPVDEYNNPVPPGVLSHKFLLTNLANYTQPIIRYEVTDRVMIDPRPCSCGSQFPRIRVEGRTDDILEFPGKNGPVRVIPVNLTPETNTPGILRYQLVQKDPRTLHMRLLCQDGFAKEDVYREIKIQLDKYLHDNDIEDISIVLVDEPPMLTTRSGKFKVVYKERPHHSHMYQGPLHTPVYSHEQAKKKCPPAG